METLLEKALKVRVNGRRKMVYSKEETEVAVAYLNGKVTTAQVAEAIGKKETSNIPSFLTSAIKSGIRDGYVTLKYNG